MDIPQLIGPSQRSSLGKSNLAARVDHGHPTVDFWPAIPQDFLFDAIVNSRLGDILKGGASVNVFKSILDAKDAESVAIAIIKAADTVALTIASGDKVQRIQGKDTDTATVPVDLRTDKADVTFEQLNFDSKRLHIAANGVTVQNILLTNTGDLRIAADHFRIFGLRAATSVSTTPIVMTDSPRYASILQCNLRPGSSSTSIISNTGSVASLLISGCLMDGTSLSDYAIKDSGTFEDSTIANNTLIAIVEGGIDLTGTRNRIIGNYLQSALGLTSGKRLIRLNTPSSGDVDTIVALNHLLGFAAADVLFEYAGTDATAQGLVLLGNMFRTGTLLCSQDMQLLSNDLAGVTVNFQSKTGIVVIGGDMTGATLQNIPSDIVFRDVKGQADRGIFTAAVAADWD